MKFLHELHLLCSVTRRFTLYPCILSFPGRRPPRLVNLYTRVLYSYIVIFRICDDLGGLIQKDRFANSELPALIFYYRLVHILAASDSDVKDTSFTAWWSHKCASLMRNLPSKWWGRTSPLERRTVRATKAIMSFEVIVRAVPQQEQFLLHLSSDRAKKRIWGSGNLPS